MALISSLASSLTGMKVAQAQLEIVSNNIANVDTKGYTRKTAAQSALVASGHTMGVTIGNTQRTVDEGLLKNFLTSNSLSNSLSSQRDYMSRLDNLMGSTEGQNSLAANVGNLQSAFETFSTSVSSPASRYQLLTDAQALTNKLNYLSTNIQTLRGDADMEINGAINQVNSLLESIDELNTEIVKYTVMNREGVANLQDQRDNALRELSSYMDITYYTRDTGAVVIQTTSGAMLLDNEVHPLSHTALAQVGPDNTYDSGNIQGIYADGVDITAKITGGSIGGLIEIRDNTLPSLQSQLDELTKVLYDEINSIHNQGTAYPNMPSTLTGSATFIAEKDAAGNDIYSQRLRIDSGDVRFVIFDTDGKQIDTTTLVGGLKFGEPNNTLNDMMSIMQDWLQNTVGLPEASVAMNGNGNLVIDTGDSNYTISIIDEVSSNAGSAQEAVGLSFSVNGDNIYDTTAKGFSDFFGLNDFFTTNNVDYIYDSKVLSNKVAVGNNTVTTWSFSDSKNGFDYGEINITKSMTIQDIANQINDNPELNTHLKASLIANGDGYMLRIESLEGAQLEIAETAGTGILAKLEMAPSNCGYSAAIQVRQDIAENANRIACGSPDFDSSKATYTINAATNNIANKLASAFTDSLVFKQSGDMAKTTTTIANYTSTFVGNVASITNTAESSYEYQSALTEAISYKEAQVSGIDIDEELSQMIIYQQSYAACAQVFTASREILDILLGLV